MDVDSLLENESFLLFFVSKKNKNKKPLSTIYYSSSQSMHNIQRKVKTIIF